MSNDLQIKSVTKGRFTASLIYDRDQTDPRKDRNVAQMWCVHGRYHLGDDTNPWPRRGCTVEEIEEREGPLALIKPLYLYDHSGITISTTPFSCRWDSGQVGWVFITQERAEKTYKPSTNPTVNDWALAILNAEVAAYDHYLTGQIYAWGLHDSLDGECIDAAGNYYDADEAWAHALKALDDAVEEDEPEGLSAAELIVHAYARATTGSAVRWEDVDLAYNQAVKELGKKRVEEIMMNYSEV